VHFVGLIFRLRYVRICSVNAPFLMSLEWEEVCSTYWPKDSDGHSPASYRRGSVSTQGLSMWEFW